MPFAENPRAYRGRHCRAAGASASAAVRIDAEDVEGAPGKSSPVAHYLCARGGGHGLLSASLLTTRVGRLHRGYLPIGDRNGRTAMPLFAYEIEFRRRRVALQTGLLQRSIEHLVAPVLNSSAVRG